MLPLCAAETRERVRVFLGKICCIASSVFFGVLLVLFPGSSSQITWSRSGSAFELLHASISLFSAGAAARFRRRTTEMQSVHDARMLIAMHLADVCMLVASLQRSFGACIPPRAASLAASSRHDSCCFSSCIRSAALAVAARWRMSSRRACSRLSSHSSQSL